jgi:hypothetical protein
MNKKNIILIIVALTFISLGFYFYRNFFMFHTTKSGLKYRFIEGEKIETPLNSDNYCFVNYAIIGPDGDTIQSSYNSDTFVEVPYPVNPQNELMEALQMASAGSKLEVKISTDSLKKKVSSHYKVQLLPSNQWTRVIFDVYKIISAQDYYVFISDKAIKRLNKEQNEIKKYIQDNKNKEPWVLDTLAKVYYRYAKNNTGKDCPILTPNMLQFMPKQLEDELEFDVVVSRLNGNLIIDSRVEGRKYKSTWEQFINEIRALNEFPFYVKPGCNMEFLVTSSFGFGANGRIGVPSYSPLHVQVFNVKTIK